MLEAALAGLSSPRTAVVLLRDRHGLDGSETAYVLGVDRATVDRRLHERATDCDVR
ncbi:MAG: sigma factor-like helix-turn-helix DNA-binding protein [Microthrixaceae bacterium]